MMEEEALESVEVIIVAQDSIDDIKTEELMVAPVVYDDVLQDHDYSMTESNFNHEKVTKEFAKCDECRKSRTKVFLPNSLLLIQHLLLITQQTGEGNHSPHRWPIPE